jgi:hypothetical protein
MQVRTKGEGPERAKFGFCLFKIKLILVKKMKLNNY